jgi:hypothetical protein
MAIANEVVDPGAIERGIDGEPAMEEDHDRGLFRSGPVRLEEPVGSGPEPDLVPADARMGRLGFLAARPARAG